MNYIGIDIGDGESCVCILPSGSQIEPRPLTITGRKSFLSAVAQDAQGQPIIGMDAVGAKNAHGFSVRFKSRFLSNDQNAHADMQLFLTGIYETLQKEGLLEEEHRVIIGCPAGWGKETRKQYAEILRAVGFRDPRLVSESRAAFLYAKHAHSIQMNPALMEESALVIDIGSSTLDFAYVVQGKETNVGTFGDVYLGGGAIDEALLKAAVDVSPKKNEILRVFEQATEWRSYCLLAVRRLKEEYFTRQAKGEKNPNCCQIITLMYDVPLPLRLQANDMLIWSVVKLNIQALNGMSFYGMLENALNYAYEQTCAVPPQLVLLTGGASRMLFFQELCRKRFPDAHFVLCDEPELSIAKGLAYSAQVDDGVYAFNQAVADYLKQDVIHQAVQGRMESFLSAASTCLADIGQEEAKIHLKKWQDGDYATLKDMNAAMGKAMEKRMKNPSAMETLSVILRNEMNEICLVLQPQIDELCVRHGVACSQMQLKLEKMPESSGTIGMELHADMAFLQKTVQALITGLVAAVMLLIPGGEIVDVALIALTAAATYVGRDFLGSFSENLPIPQKIRQKISFDRIFTSKFYQQLVDSFRKKLSQDNAFQDAVSTAIESDLATYVKHMAQKTEIAISSGEDDCDV